MQSAHHPEMNVEDGAGALSRRTLLRRVVAGGLALPILGGLLQACSSPAPTAPAAATSKPAAAPAPTTSVANPVPANAAPAGGATKEKITFLLDWIPFGRHAPYYIALEKGYYSQAGLDVTIQQGTGTTPGLRSLAAGQAQLNFNDIGSMLVVRSQEGLKIRALACVYQKSPHTIFFIKGKGIEKPKDLEGKRIAYSPGDSPKAMFPAFAKANGIDESKVVWSSVDPNSKNSVLLNHQVDAMMTYILTLPVLEKAAQGGDQIGTFVYGDLGADFYANAVLATEEYITQKPAAVKGFVQATIKGLQSTFDSPKDAIGILKKYQPQLEEDSALKEVDIIRDLAINDDTKKNGLGHMTAEKMQQTKDLTFKYLELKNDLSVDSLYTNDFLKA